ncbi:cytochrome b/b6 domain-containing protein [Thalassotalea sp. G2M2-11]|uniref:cytochrome b/b6 domain-containing protein n=1 Tax=Thalassotalea sp. G2M2-11 TaxID=2787627 RepID=UPI0019CF9A3F|nr:cytochrome b/b6 domain-containing protein [Thalassotalea sp. G2M2-11]
MTTQHLVWDLPIRLFHWGFVGLLIALWYTSDQDNGLIELHMQLGYIALALVLFRIIWGFIGTTHAKFKNFIPSFYQLRIYIRQRNNNVKQYAGHNPMGSLMVLLMLLLILLQSISGLFMSDDVFSAGPYAGVLSGDMEGMVKFFHHNGFDFIVIISAIHIAAVFYYLLVKRQNLIKPMLSGKKHSQQIEADQAIGHSKLIKALLTAIAVGIFVYWLVVLNAPVVEEFYY